MSAVREDVRETGGCEVGIVIVLWLVFAVFVGKMADKRGRSGWGWGILAVVISPILAAIGLLLAGGKGMVA
jgi:hypothetical protein